MIVFIYSDGVGRTGMFCSLLSAMEQINKEKVVDVFQLVNKMRSCQPSILQNFVSLISCFFPVIFNFKRSWGMERRTDGNLKIYLTPSLPYHLTTTALLFYHVLTT